MSNSEKIVIDLGSVRIDLSVESEPFPVCENLNHAEIQLQEEMPALEINQPAARTSFVLGALLYSRSDLERYRSRRERVKVKMAGMFSLARDIPPALALEVVESVKVYGIFHAQTDVKDALTKAGRIS